MSSSTIPDPSSRHYTYSRKQKSLGLLCTNFLSLYNRDGIHLIGLDDAASRLGVERRRVYDIVNVLESVGVLARKAKNQYTWKGFAAIPGALQELKDEGLRESPNGFDGANDSAKVSDDEDDEETLSNPNTESQNDKSNSNSTFVQSLKNDVGEGSFDDDFDKNENSETKRLRKELESEKKNKYMQLLTATIREFDKVGILFSG